MIQLGSYVVNKPEELLLPGTCPNGHEHSAVEEDR